MQRDLTKLKDVVYNSDNGHIYAIKKSKELMFIAESSSWPRGSIAIEYPRQSIKDIDSLNEMIWLSPHGAASVLLRMHDLGVIDPTSSRSLEIFKSGQLTSNERLYFSLWGSKLLSSINFDAKQRVFTQGEAVHDAYFIVSGNLLGIDGDRIERLGPGSILCLAEGLAGLPASKTIVAVNSVQARIIPLHKVDQFVPHLPQALRTTIRTNVMRTLGLKSLPKGVL